MECSLRSQQLEQHQQDAISEQGERPPQVAQGACRVTWRDRFDRWRQLQRERDALRNLSDDMLNDIGLSRETAKRESRRPFWDDRGWRR